MAFKESLKGRNRAEKPRWVRNEVEETMPKNAVKTRFPGVYSVESSCRRYEGKPDVCYYFVVKLLGKSLWQKTGWRSEGYTATVAHDLRNEYIQSARQGKPLPRKKVLTFRMAWDEYASRHLPTLKAPQAIKSMVSAHLLPVFGDWSLSIITPRDVQDLANRMFCQGLSPQSVAHTLAFLRHIFRKTAAWGLHSFPSPTDGVAKIKVDNGRKRFLTREEAANLLHELRKHSSTWHDMAALSLVTGCRLSEMRTLRCGYIHLEAGIMEVDGKTGRRVVRLSESAKSILIPRMACVPSRLVFPGRKGGLVTKSSSTFSDAVKACGFNPPGTRRQDLVVFHTLRHTFASWLAMDGVPLIVIAELMGHSSVKMTERYSHLCPGTTRNAVDNLSKTLHGVIPFS